MWLGLASQQSTETRTHCHMLTYNMASPERNKFSPYWHPEVACMEIYDPPTPEFTVARVTIPPGTKEILLPGVHGVYNVHMACGHISVYMYVLSAPKEGGKEC